jgi:hypothetical protein
MIEDIWCVYDQQCLIMVVGSNAFFIFSSLGSNFWLDH